MTKRALKRLYKQYILGAGRDGHKQKDGSSWEDMISVFAFNIPETEREAIHRECCKKCPLAA
jgi:hypothetical protein